MLALRPLMVRFVCLSLAVMAGAGLAARAPQAFRAWVDTAADVAPAQRAAARRTPRQPPARTRATEGSAADRTLLAQSLRLSARPVAALPSDRASLDAAGWPLARAGRDVLVLKRARLI